MSEPTITPRLGAGSTVFYGDSNPATTQLGAVREIGEPDISVSKVDTEHMTTADLVKEPIPGWVELNEIAMTVRYDATQSGTIVGLVRLVKHWQVRKPDGSHWDFQGYVSKFGGENPIDNLIQTKFSIQPTTKPVLTPASSSSSS